MTAAMATTWTRPTACVRGCTIRGLHLDACAEAACDGCLPARPAPGLWVCERDEKRVREFLRDMPALWADLAQPIPGRRAGGTPKVDGLELHLHTRHAIRACLVAWCIVLHEDYGMTYPADTVRAMAHHVSVQAGRLLDSEHADQLVHDVEHLYGTAWALARPSSGSTFTIECECGARVPIDTEPDVMIRCPNRDCGEAGVLSWWIEHSAPPVDFVTIKGAPDVLWGTYRLRVTEAMVEHWATRGKIAPSGVEDADGPGRPAAVYFVRQILRVALEASDRKGRRQA
jgi:hypothetical protein